MLTRRDFLKGVVGLLALAVPVSLAVPQGPSHKAPVGALWVSKGELYVQTGGGWKLVQERQLVQTRLEANYFMPMKLPRRSSDA